jgi:hypothetical protein
VAVSPPEFARGAVRAGRPRRDQQDHAPEVVFLGSGPRPHLAGWLLVVAGEEGSELVGAAREAARTRDATGLTRFLDARSAANRRVKPEFGGMHAIVRVSYHGTPLAEGPIVPEGPGGFTVLLPFPGGALDRNGFCASAYFAAGNGAGSLATFVIVCEPQLSDFEHRAVDRLGREMGRMALGCGLDAGAPLERLIELRAELIRAGRLR